MSYSVDANILVHASNERSPHQAAAAEFISARAADRDLFCLSWATVHAYLRICTHPGIFERPLAPSKAAANIEQLLELPRVRLIAEGDDHWRALREASEGLQLKGNLVPDAALAAVLMQHGVTTLYTADRDFRRFGFLKVVNPLG